MPGDAGRGIQQRVLFPVNTQVDPDLTVSMNDQSLYGYIHAGASRALPAGMRVSYRSDNPAVVDASGGTVRTLSNGVATITAFVTYHGVTASGQFVVRVLSELAAIELQPRPTSGTSHHKHSRRPSALPLQGFEPDTYTYDVLVPAGQRAPSITAKSSDHRATVRIAQAAAVPGQARATVTGPDGLTQVYTIYFARPAGDFTGRIGAQWKWINEDPANARVAGTSLQISATPGSLTDGSARNVLIEPALGDWTVNTRLTLSATPSAAGQQAGIVAYQDDGDYLTLDWEYDPGSGARLVETTTDSLSGSPVSQVLATASTAGVVGHTVWLRMIKRGPRYDTYYSDDGTHFAPIYSAGADLSNVKVGAFAVGSGQTASFGYFHVKNSGPVSLH
jgi:regulation of enolase protein 1 (concanavalin A-like superfamily)